jgi:hypothetical protein
MADTLTAVPASDRFHSGIILEPTQPDMATLTIKGMPDALYERIRESAGANYRSINSEVIMRLEQALGSRRAAPEDLLARIRRARAGAGVQVVTDAFIREARAEGRP